MLALGSGCGTFPAVAKVRNAVWPRILTNGLATRTFFRFWLLVVVGVEGAAGDDVGTGVLVTGLAADLDTGLSGGANSSPVPSVSNEI